MIDIRCECRRRPLLAVAGRDDDGSPFIHIKAHKQKQVISEVVVTDGTAHIRCRSCNRWHRIVIRPTEINRQRQPLPEGIFLQ